MPWPLQLASGRPKADDVSLSTTGLSTLPDLSSPSALKRASAYKLGTRCEHARHGVGVVTGMGKFEAREVSFQNGEKHVYRPESLHKLKPISPPGSEHFETSRPTLLMFSSDNPGVEMIAMEIQQYIAGVSLKRLGNEARSKANWSVAGEGGRSLLKMASLAKSTSSPAAVAERTPSSARPAPPHPLAQLHTDSEDRPQLISLTLSSASLFTTARPLVTVSGK